MRYRLTKLQIKRLLEDKPVTDCRGRKFLASKLTKDALTIINNNDLYGKFDVLLAEDGSIHIADKLGVTNE